MLVLNQGYEPVSVCNTKKAMILLLLSKAELIARQDGNLVRTVSRNYPSPSVIRLSRFVKIPFKNIEPTRRNILRRDGYHCQYCGTKTSNLTIDHVVPKSRGGGENWENLVSACLRCNNLKGNHTPEEAGLTLLNKPRRPHPIIFFKQFMGKTEDTWKTYLFMD